MGKLIPFERSVIVACDVPNLLELDDLASFTCDVPGIGGYKVGSILAVEFGLSEVVKTIRRHTNLPIIYDHQKAATDIPKLGPDFIKAVRNTGVEGIILFPLSGCETEKMWIRACQEMNFPVLVGGHMTHEGFLAYEGGFIVHPERIYLIAAECGVTDFVVPGNKPEFVAQYLQLLERRLGKGNFTLYAPGFITQGGDISETGKVAGDNWHAIVGSAIYDAEDIHNAACTVASQIALDTNSSGLMKEH